MKQFILALMILGSLFGHGSDLTLYPDPKQKVPLNTQYRMTAIFRYQFFDPETWPEVEIKKINSISSFIFRNHDEYRIRLPVYDEATKKFITAQFHFYSPRAKKNSPSSQDKDSRLVVIYPSIEGETIVEKTLALKAIKAGHSVLVANDFNFPLKSGPDGILDFKNNMTNGVKGLYTFFDFITYMYRNPRLSSLQNKTLAAFQKVIPHSIIQVAISNGGAPAQYVARDARVSEQVLIVPVANAPAVMATSENDKVAAFRKDQMKNLKMEDPMEYARYLRRVLEVDPIDLADHIRDHVHTTIFTQTNDVIVPSKYQMELVQRYKTSYTRYIYNDELAELQFLKMLVEAYPELQQQLKDNFQQYSQKSIKNIADAALVESSAVENFHDMAWGHVPKILSVVFYFNDAITAAFKSNLRYRSYPRQKDDLAIYQDREPLFIKQKISLMCRQVFH